MEGSKGKWVPNTGAATNHAPFAAVSFEMAEDGAIREIKEWQAIMDHIRTLPVKNQGELPTILIDDRAKEVRAIKVG